MAKRTADEEKERGRIKTYNLYHRSDEYKEIQAIKDFRKRDSKQVVEVSILELAERLRAILGGKQ